ncbi:MAG TPA: gamma-glutamyltransferase [Candidatus Dormibacteraeota bacterium]|nr:gamma-glutamyltransferase [Candidatus Dormibacteraeota bacterium]
MIASPHRLASEAGAQVLRDGGNAIDAAIAANAVLCVVYPHMTSLGGDLMAIVWPAGASAPVGLIGAGRSGELATVAAVRDRGHDSMPERGVLTVTVPGTVEAWGRLIERFGTFGWAPLMEPAAALAKDGYVITPQLSEFLKGAAEMLNREQAAYSLYPPMDSGMLLRNPDLASVLGDIGRHGFNGFYRGEIAAAIVAAIAKRHGFVTANDMATHRSDWVETVTLPYRDVVVHELPPPTQGLIALSLLKVLGARKSEELRPGPAFASMFRSVCDEAYRIRGEITDPDFAPAPQFASAEVPDGGDTIYLCAADEHGNLVSLIQSVAFDFGSGIVAEGTGILLQNRGCYFSLDPNHANRLEPKKRTRHTLIPALATRDGQPWLLYGSMGGDGQPQLQTQVLMNIVDHGLDPQDAVARPRIRVTADGRTVTVEANYPGAKGSPDVELLPPGHHSLGHAHAIVIDGPGRWRAGSDPRADGSVERVG